MVGLQGFGIDVGEPLTLTAISAVLSNIFSNVPAVMVLIRFLDPADQHLWYILAVSSTFAGNFILLGSIANLIVVEQALAEGVVVSFAEHARIGIPVTLASLAILAGWIAVAG